MKASWGSLGLALGCLCVLFLFQLADQMTPFAREARGVLTNFLPRALLYLLWAGEALAVVVGLAGLVFIRRHDAASKAVPGIVVRSLCGIVVGFFATIFLWLVVGHTVIGF